MGKRLLPEKKEEAVRLYIEGLPVEAISIQTGVSAPHLKTLVKLAGAPRRPQGFQLGNRGRTGPKPIEEKIAISRSHKTSGHRPPLAAIKNGQPKTLQARWGRHIRDPIKHLMRAYKTGAERRKLCFELTREDVEILVAGACFYCGAPPSERKVAKNLRLVCNGIDRIENSIGYVRANCRSACKVCNVMKSSRTTDDFIAHCTRIAEKWRIPCVP